MRQLLLLSTTRVHGGQFLDYCREEVKTHFNGLDEILFIPYARPGGISFDEYTDVVRVPLKNLGIDVRGIHQFDDPSKALTSFGGIYTGGGNTFLLLKTLYETGLIESLPPLVKSGRLRYMGSSAGTNVACPTINTTNDMPIVYPPSFKSFDLVPFNINPHYLDPDVNSTHMGETRETRIKEFQFQSDRSVIGLREGSWLTVKGDVMGLHGRHSARCFEKGKEAYEIDPKEDLSFLLKVL